MVSSSWRLSVLGIGVLISASVCHAESDEAKQEKPKKAVPTLSVAEARRHAKLLHNTYEATLHTVHREYFHEGGRTPVPARVLEEVFYWVDEETHGETRWIAVNTEAMSIDHNAETEFEKKAVKELSKGNEDFEQVEDGMYRRVGAITLFATCLRCHESSLTQIKTKRRVAGLVISLPILPEAPKK